MTFAVADSSTVRGNLEVSVFSETFTLPVDAPQNTAALAATFGRGIVFYLKNTTDKAVVFTLKRKTTSASTDLRAVQAPITLGIGNVVNTTAEIAISDPGPFYLFTIDPNGATAAGAVTITAVMQSEV